MCVCTNSLRAVSKLQSTNCVGACSLPGIIHRLIWETWVVRNQIVLLNRKIQMLNSKLLFWFKWLQADSLVKFSVSYPLVLVAGCWGQSWPAVEWSQTLVWCWRRRGVPSWLFWGPALLLAVWRQEWPLPRWKYFLKVKVWVSMTAIMTNNRRTMMWA